MEPPPLNSRLASFTVATTGVSNPVRSHDFSDNKKIGCLFCFFVFSFFFCSHSLYMRKVQKNKSISLSFLGVESWRPKLFFFLLKLAMLMVVLWKKEKKDKDKKKKNLSLSLSPREKERSKERERNSRAVSLQKGTNQPATRMSLNRSQRSCRSTKYGAQAKT